VLLLAVFGCRSERHGSLQLVLGKSSGERPLEIELRAAFAEYVVLPELRHELRITLASYDTSCRAQVLPTDKELVVVVTVATPPHQPPATGSFDWAGHAAHGGSPERPERAYALPLVRQGSNAYEFRPGGGIELRQLGLGEGGALAGLLNFEFTGDATHPAQAIKGSFAGRVCPTLPAAGQGDD
jgi:hypothetical protein